MNATLGVIDLDDFRDLFANETAYRSFLEKFGTAMKADLRPIVAGTKLFGAALSAERTKDYLTEKVAKRLVRRPELLAELTRRLEEDEIVD